MSFYPQKNSYTCGPFALKYALVMLGIFKNEKDIAKFAGSTFRAGTDETGLAKAAKKFKCEMVYFHKILPEDALQELNKRLEKNIPCILSVNNWGHWATVLRYDKKRYIVVDSGMERVISALTPSQLLKKWKYEEAGLTSFDGYALVPKFKVAAKAFFTLDKVKFLMYKRNAELAYNWDTYFEDMTDICIPRTLKTSNFITFSEFLRRHEKLITEQIIFWHGNPDQKELKRILKNFQFVCEVYDLVVLEREEKKAIIAVTSLLMMYACGKYGMDPFFIED